MELNKNGTGIANFYKSFIEEFLNIYHHNQCCSLDHLIADL